MVSYRRAYAAYVGGIAINVVGFAGASASHSEVCHTVMRLTLHTAAGRPVPAAAIHIYDLSFFTGFAVSATIYWTLNRLFPAVGAAGTFTEVDLSGMTDNAQDIGGIEDDVEAEGSEISKVDDALTSVHSVV